MKRAVIATLIVSLITSNIVPLQALSNVAKSGKEDAIFSVVGTIVFAVAGVVSIVIYGDKRQR